jgi:hypothetical protein
MNCPGRPSNPGHPNPQSAHQSCCLKKLFEFSREMRGNPSGRWQEETEPATGPSLEEFKGHRFMGQDGRWRGGPSWTQSFGRSSESRMRPHLLENKVILQDPSREGVANRVHNIFQKRSEGCSWSGALQPLKSETRKNTQKNMVHLQSYLLGSSRDDA